MSRTIAWFCLLQSLCVGEMPQVSELGSCQEVSAGPDIQSHRAPTRAADEMRLGLRRPAYRAEYARALHYMSEAAPGCSNPGSNQSHHRRRGPNVKRGPPGPRMKCGWGCGAQLTERSMHETARRFTSTCRARSLDHVPQRGGDEELAARAPPYARRASSLRRRGLAGDEFER